jgi:hypothetical protein
MAETPREKPHKKGKHRAKEERAALAELTKGKGDALGAAKKQLKTAARVAGIALIVIWLIAVSLVSGTKSIIPVYVAAGLTVTMGVAAVLIRRNLGKSEELGAMLSDGAELSAEERQGRIAKLTERVAKGDAAAIIAKAQLEMQEAPRDALKTLEQVDLDKAQKLVALQVRGMRAMIHLNLGEVNSARDLVDSIDLSKSPDLKLRANLAGIIAETWARSGNPIEANQLLDKYDPDDKEFADVRVQLLRARTFSTVHANDIDGMRRALKALEQVSPQLMALFVGQKRIHPLLMQEAKKRLEKSGFAPKQRIVARH